MPFTTDFNKIRRRLHGQYDDKAKAETFAFKKAFNLGIATFEPRRRKFKKQGQAVVSALLYFFMAIVIVALFMPVVREVITNRTATIENGTHGALLSILVSFWPVYLVIMLFIILIVLVRR